MTNSKNTKRALFASVLSLLLCVSMLVGSTFAWFTDSVSTGVNKIQSGTLKVDLVDEKGNSLKGQTIDFVKADGAEEKEFLWEPGCTYELPKVFVKNKGNLALKYKIIITGINGDAKLNEVIEWKINNTDMNNVDMNTEYKLGAGEQSEAITISGHMKETANNDYQSLSIEGIAITVVATQDTVENDSFNNEYDEKAAYDPIAIVNVTENLPIKCIMNDYVGEANTPITLESAYKFEAMNTLTDAENSHYANWNADFVISTDKAIPDGAITVAGQYDFFSKDWIAFENKGLPIPEGGSYRMIKDFTNDNIKVTYKDLCDWVKVFNCGIKGSDAVTGATVTVELRLFETNENGVETDNYVVIGSYPYTFK